MDENLSLTKTESLELAPVGFLRAIVYPSPFSTERVDLTLKVGVNIRDAIEIALERPLCFVGEDVDGFAVLIDGEVRTEKDVLEFEPASQTAVYIRVYPGLEWLIPALIATSAVLNVAAIASGNQTLAYVSAGVGLITMGFAALNPANIMQSTFFGGLGSGITNSQALTAGFLMAGAAGLVSGLVRAQDAIPEGAVGGIENSTYLKGGSNSIAQWRPIPSVFGSVSWAAPYGSEPYREVDDDANEYLNTLLVAGYGPLEIDWTSTTIGGTNILNYRQDAFEIDVREGYETDGPRTLVPPVTINSTDLGITLLAPGETYEERITSDDQRTKIWRIVSDENGDYQFLKRKSAGNDSAHVAGTIYKNLEMLQTTLAAGGDSLDSTDWSDCWLLPAGAVKFRMISLAKAQGFSPKPSPNISVGDNLYVTLTHDLNEDGSKKSTSSWHRFDAKLAERVTVKTIESSDVADFNTARITNTNTHDVILRQDAYQIEIDAPGLPFTHRGVKAGWSTYSSTGATTANTHMRLAPSDEYLIGYNSGYAGPNDQTGVFSLPVFSDLGQEWTIRDTPEKTSAFTLIFDNPTAMYHWNDDAEDPDLFKEKTGVSFNLTIRDATNPNGKGAWRLAKPPQANSGSYNSLVSSGDFLYGVSPRQGYLGATALVPWHAFKWFGNMNKNSSFQIRFSTPYPAKWEVAVVCLALDDFDLDTAEDTRDQFTIIWSALQSEVEA